MVGGVKGQWHERRLECEHLDRAAGSGYREPRDFSAQGGGQVKTGM